MAMLGGELGVAVADVCGAVEVRVKGPVGELQLLFDPAEALPAYVRHAVRRTVERYWASLSDRTCPAAGQLGGVDHALSAHGALQ